jgi:alanine racemase
MKKIEIQPVWAEIRLDAVAANVRALKKLLPAGCRLMAVVKADGYGHGAVRVARTALENGAERLAVARLAEGLALRQAGVRAPILLFGYTPPENLEQVLDHDLTPTLYSLETARAHSAKAASVGRRLAVHLKIDTGMGRLGVLPNCLRTGNPSPASEAKLVKDIKAIAALPHIEIEGVYTHFAAADSADKRYAHRQFDIFQSILDQLAANGVDVELRHAANSAATIELPKTHLDLVRPGISIYGFYPSDDVDKRIVTLEPAMALKTRIIQLKRVPTGFHVSYGMTYTTERPTTIATVPLGYADGYSRKLSSRGTMLVRGVRAPIVGRVCMDLTMLDVGAVPGVQMEDEVVAFGRQGDAEITADEVAATLETINYEIVSSLTARVPKVYKSSHQ